MSYHVKLTDSDVVFPKENQQEILNRWHEMNLPKYDSVKQGGSYNKDSRRYLWMPENYHKTTRTPEAILKLLGFAFSHNFFRDILIGGYEGKVGQEKLFFKKIGDLVSSGSFMAWRGEGGVRYDWYFDGKTMQEVDAKRADIPMSVKVEDNVKCKVEPVSKYSRYTL